MWNTLTKEQKKQYKKYCDDKYGKTFTECETGEPLYFDKKCHLIDTKIIIDLLFSTTKN